MKACAEMGFPYTVCITLSQMAFIPIRACHTLTNSQMGFIPVHRAGHTLMKVIQKASHIVFFPLVIPLEGLCEGSEYGILNVHLASLPSGIVQQRV